MKEVKVIHINDGTGNELTNGNRHYAFDCVWAGEMLSMYLNAGYEISQVIPDFTPGEPGSGGYAFYKTGFTAIMVRELTEDSVVITKEDWDEKISHSKASLMTAKTILRNGMIFSQHLKIGKMKIGNKYAAQARKRACFLFTDSFDVV